MARTRTLFISLKGQTSESACTVFGLFFLIRLIIHQCSLILIFYVILIILFKEIVFDFLCHIIRFSPLGPPENHELHTSNSLGFSCRHNYRNHINFQFRRWLLTSLRLYLSWLSGNMNVSIYSAYFSRWIVSVLRLLLSLEKSFHFW